MGDENKLNEHPVGGIERLNGAVVVRLVGELDLYNAPEVRVALLEVCAEQPERLVVDLGEVDFVDSTALGVLIEARTKLDNRQSFLLASPGLETHRALTISGLDQHLSVHDTVESALAASVSRLMLAELSATALLLSGVGARGRHRSGATTANGIPAYVDGYREVAAAQPRPDPRRLVRAPGNQERLREQAQDGRRYPVGTIVVKTAMQPGKKWLSLVATMRKVKGTTNGGWRWEEFTRSSSTARFTKVGFPSPAVPPATRRPSRTTSSSRGARQRRAAARAPGRARASRAAPRRRGARRRRPACP